MKNLQAYRFLLLLLTLFFSAKIFFEWVHFCPNNSRSKKTILYLFYSKCIYTTYTRDSQKIDGDRLVNRKANFGRLPCLIWSITRPTVVRLKLNQVKIIKFICQNEYYFPVFELTLYNPAAQLDIKGLSMKKVFSSTYLPTEAIWNCYYIQVVNFCLIHLILSMGRMQNTNCYD